MTRISTIHGVPFSEFEDRNTEAAQTIEKTYFPYLSMTAGQLELWLLRQRAQIFQAWAPDLPVYSQAVRMIDQALKAGPDGAKFIGAVPDELQPLAAMISSATKRTKPASRAGFFPARINGPIPVSQRVKECLENAKNPVEKAACVQKFQIETILNNGIEKSGHHLLYKSIPKSYAVPNDVSTKRILHQTGVEGMALVGEIPNDLMYLWVENGILAKNIQHGVGPLNSATTSVYLAPDPEQSVDNFRAWLSNQPASNRQRIKNGGIGKIAIDPITAGVIIAIAGALTAAAEMLKEMRKQKAYAMVQAQGFGTNAFSATQGDWLSGSGAGSGTPQNWLPWLLIGGAVYLATK